MIPSLLAELLISPSKFFSRIASGENLGKLASGIYFVSMMAASLFYAYKPQGFPEDSFSADVGRHSVAFWLGMGALGFVMTLIMGGVIRLLLRFLQGQWSASFGQILAVLLASHIWYLLLFLVLTVGVWTRSAQLYKTAELVFSLIGFVVTVVGIKTVARATAPKVVASVVVSSLALVAALFGLYLAGALPTEVLKVLLFV